MDRNGIPFEVRAFEELLKKPNSDLTGLAGLMNVPVLGPLFGNNTRSKDTSKVLLVIKPTVTSMPASEFVTRTFWFGSETKPLTLL